MSDPAAPAIIGFATDVRPKFRDFDVNAMKAARNIDLSSYDDVKKHSKRILKRLEMGDMPCDTPWPDDWVKTFKQWITDGMLP